MKKFYNIEVDCAICAANMEEAAKKVEGVKSVVVNFMMLRMVVEFENGYDPKTVMKQVLGACQKVAIGCDIEL